MRRKVIFLVWISICFLFLTGCWGSRETDQLGYVLVIGLDKGEENIIKVTFQMAIPEPVEGGQAEKVTEVVSVEAPSIFAAQELTDTFVSKRSTLIHNKAIVVSEEIAREGLSKYINPLVRSRDLRRTNYLLVTQGKAHDFIKENINLIFERYPSRQLDIFMTSTYMTGLIPNADIHKFYEALSSPGRQAIAALVGVEKNKDIQNKEQQGEEDKEQQGDQDKEQQEQQNKEQEGEPQAQDKKKETKSEKEKVEEGMAYVPGKIPREGGNKIEMIGTAVFHDDRLVGFLNGEETRYYQMITGGFGRGNFTFPDPDPVEGGSNIINLEIKKGRSPEIKIDPAQEKINLRLFLEGEILSIQSGENYERGALKRQLEDYVSNSITKNVMQLIRKTQDEYRSDIFGFGEYTRIDFWTWRDWVEYEWLRKYPQYQVNVETVFQVRRSGMMTGTSPIHRGGSE
jgi:spore germination protein KC